MAHLFQCVVIWWMGITHYCMNTSAQSCKKPLSNKQNSMFKSCCSREHAFNFDIQKLSLALFARKRCGMVILHEAITFEILQAGAILFREIYFKTIIL